MATVSDIVSLRIDTKCRICMFPKPNLSSLFRRGLSMKVMKLADIKMYEGDGLPSTICLDCELEVNRCVNFIGQIQRADMKLREMIDRESEFIEAYERDKELAERSKEMELGIQKVEDGDQEACTSQIDIEEFNVKQEITTLDNFLDEEADPKSESDHDHFEVALARNDEPEDEHELNPLNHVDVMEDENRSDAMDVPLDPLGQEEPLIESEKCDSNPSTDPLTFMKQEAVSMDIDKNSPEPSGSSSTVVKGSLITKAFAIWPFIYNDSERKKTQRTLELNQETDKSSDNEDQCSQSVLAEMSDKTALVHESEGVNSQESFCRTCNVECGSIELLNKHKEDNIMFNCRVCSLEFVTHVELETHIDTHKKVKCGKCKEIVFTKSELHLHWNEKHNHERFACDICSKTYTTKTNLNRHKLWDHVHKLKNTKLECIVCKSMFSGHSALNEHLKKNHLVFENIECKICNNIFLGPARLKYHMTQIHRKRTPEKCETCGKVFMSLVFLVRHQKIHDQSERLCEICGESIIGKVGMKNHLRYEHHSSKEVGCKLCSEKFNDEASLRNHRSKHHKRRYLPKPAICEICGKQYKSSEILNIHKRIHSAEKKFKCGICGASFTQSGTLNTHKRVHSDVGKYKCDTCGLTFKWKQTMENHIKKCQVDGDVFDSALNSE